MGNVEYLLKPHSSFYFICIYTYFKYKGQCNHHLFFRCMCCSLNLAKPHLRVTDVTLLFYFIIQKITEKISQYIKIC